MTLSRPANGNATHELAHAAAFQAVASLAGRKNVSFDTARQQEIAQGALEWLNAGQLAGVCALHPKGIKTLEDKINLILDMLVMAKISGCVSAIEDTESVSDPIVAAVVKDIVGEVRRAAPDPACIVWPNYVQLVESYYARRARKLVATNIPDAMRKEQTEQTELPTEMCDG